MVLTMRVSLNLTSFYLSKLGIMTIFIVSCEGLKGITRQLHVA